MHEVVGQKIKLSHVAIIIVVFLTAISCKSKKAIINSPIEKVITLKNKVLVDGILNNQLSFKTFSAKAKSSVSLNKDVYDATLNVKIKNNEVIWISITTLFGIEAARVLITPNRFKMMNRLNGTYLDKPFDFLYQFASSEITFDNLQAMMVGNMISQALQYTETAVKTKNGYSLTGSHNDLGFSVQTNEGFKIIACSLKASDRQQEVATSYADFDAIAEQPFAKSIRLAAISAALKLDLQLKYNRIALNEPLEIPFTIPSKYKELGSEN